MLSTPHRKFCEGIVSGLTGVRAYSLAYPRCSLKIARVNASHLRAKPQIQQEIARMRAQADAIAGPAVLTLIEKRVWLARVVRANLARLDPEIDGDLLVSLHVEEGRKRPRVRRMRIVNKLVAIRIDSHLAGDETATSTAEDSLAALIKRVTEQPYPPVPPTAPQTSPGTPSPESTESKASADHHESVNSESSTASPDIPPQAPDSTFDLPIAPSTIPVTPVFPPPRPRFDPGPDFAARERARRRQPVRHLW